MSITLLDMTQDILADLESDQVNSIGDTTEAYDIARLISRQYRTLISQYELEMNESGIQLESYIDPDRPTHMLLPSEMSRVDTIMYDVRRSDTLPQQYVKVSYKDPKDFISFYSNMDLLSPQVTRVELESGMIIGVWNDRTPSYFTLMGERTLVFDSYLSESETTLHASKSWAYGEITRRLRIEDGQVIPLSPELEDLLYFSSSEMAADLWAGGAARSIVNASRKARVRVQRNSDKLRRSKSADKTDYGRNSVKSGLARPEGIDAGAVKPLPDYLKR